ncbi:uncharacterized protein MKK02DRAFT_40755 [Dioszegia hungarica]|uniref:Uncharacterized protein n=1 Tax=Dioszegia hungarica TaxID=4972 RepID=A0AA38H271_9TREE|nr:uncharacterized protein MKK02DRAFT_40755 [Dioszegia hungarica]KAI9632452.1 hypothetical protein MKK02DRAFT_40755 [Dioszegia hungarica]
MSALPLYLLRPGLQRSADGKSFDVVVDPLELTRSVTSKDGRREISYSESHATSTSFKFPFSLPKLSQGDAPSSLANILTGAHTLEELEASLKEAARAWSGCKDFLDSEVTKVLMDDDGALQLQLQMTRVEVANGVGQEIDALLNTVSILQKHAKGTAAKTGKTEYCEIHETMPAILTAMTSIGTDKIRRHTAVALKQSGEFSKTVRDILSEDERGRREAQWMVGLAECTSNLDSIVNDTKTGGIVNDKWTALGRSASAPDVLEVIRTWHESDKTLGESAAAEGLEVLAGRAVEKARALQELIDALKSSVDPA